MGNRFALAVLLFIVFIDGVAVGAVLIHDARASNPVEGELGRIATGIEKIGELLERGCR